MARQVITTLIDDLDGGKADETVLFGLEGAEYQIDLSGKNGLRLRRALEPYVNAATKAGQGGITRSASRTRRPASSPDENAAIRAWAAANGYEVSDRGRIPVSVISAYRSSRRG